jgi:hypothetical protein
LALIIRRTFKNISLKSTVFTGYLKKGEPARDHGGDSERKDWLSGNAARKKPHGSGLH